MKQQLYSLFISICLLFFLENYATARIVDTISSKRWEFVENKGQFDKKVNFCAKTDAGAVFFEKNSYKIVQYNSAQLQDFSEAKHSGRPFNSTKLDAFAYQIDFLNSNPNVKNYGLNKFPYHFNYFIGKSKEKWASNVSIFEQVYYENIYENINLRFKSKDNYLKYEFEIFPNGDYHQIKLKYSGLKKLSRVGENLLLYTSFDRNVELAPFAYQIDNKGDTTKIECSYKVDGEVVSFIVGSYEKSLPLIIDPTIVFSSYTGSTADNWGYSATYDKHGNLYGGGIVFETGYPVTLGAFQVNYCNLIDVGISKFNQNGNSLLYSTYLGGNNMDIPHSMYVNYNDELFVFGTTGSADFPVSATAFNTSFNGGENVTLSTNLNFNNGCDLFISKFSADGSQLLASTYVGGSKNDGLNTATALRKNYADDNRGEIEVDDYGNVYVVTTTRSQDFPVTQGCYQSALQGNFDACVFKMSSDLSFMIWSTFFGGNSSDAGYSLAIADDYSVYFCGGTISNDLPHNYQSYQNSYADTGNVADGYLAHISANGSNLLHFTYLGKQGYDQAYLVENDKNGNVYAFGQTSADSVQWVQNAQYFIPNGGQFLIKLKPDLSQAVWSTAFGSGNVGPDISPTAFMVDYCNNIYLSGWGSHNLNGFGGTFGLPVTDDAFQVSTDGSDFYFMTLNNDASNLEFATFFGSSFVREHVDGGTSRFDKHGCIYQAVCAGCGGSNSFPTTINAYSQINGSSNCNLGVVKINFNLPTVVADFIVPSVICIGDTLFFQNYSQVIGNQTSVLWNFGDGSTSSQWNPYHIYQNQGNYLVTLIVQDAQSCNFADTITKQISIFSNSTSYLDDKNICTNDFVELGIPSVAGVSYSWHPENDLSNASISNPIATPSQTTNYMLIANNGSCYDTIYQKVIVHLLTISVNSDSNLVLLCKGETANISISVDSEDNYTIEWSDTPDFQNIIASNQLSIAVTPEQTTNYYARVKSEYCEQIVVIPIEVYELIISSADEYLLCFENEVQLSADVLAGSAPFQYSWNVAGYGSSTDDSPQFTINHSTTYSVTIEDANGCSSTVSGNIVVQEGTFPEELVAWCDPCEVLAYHPTTLHSTDYGDDYTYQWIPATDLETPNLQSTVAVPAESTIYTVIVTDSFGCIKTDTVFVRTDPVSCDNPFVFIPNSFTPNGDGINDVLYVRSDILSECYFVIYSRWGEKIFETNDQTIGWDGTFKNKDCQRGVYDYYFKGRCVNGDDIEMKGNISLVR